MKKKLLVALVTGLVIAGVAAMVMADSRECRTEDRACAADNAGEPSETVLAIEQVPAAVAATIRREAGGATINEIVRKDGCGRSLYEAELLTDGRERDLLVRPDGSVVGEEALAEVGEGCEPPAENARESSETKLTIDQVPAPVAATIRRVGDGMILREIVRVSENGQTIYEATLLSRGREGELRLSADGSILPEAAEDAGEDGGDDDDEDEAGRSN